VNDPADISLGAEPKPTADARLAPRIPDARAFAELALERAVSERDVAVAREGAAREDAAAAHAALERERGRLLDEVRHRAAELKGALGEGRVLGAVTTLTDVTRERERDEQREDLLRGVSHDLRTPLTTVLLHAQRLAKHADADVRRRADSIITAGRRMDALISDLVESARLEADQIQLSPRPLALGPFVEELLSRSPALGLGRVRLTADAQAVALADPERIERAVANLLSNALKYSPPDSPVRVCVARAGSEVEIAITDQGEGIPAEELPRLFGRYWRSRRANSVEGTGLGLYITRLLVEAHGGHVRAESALGAGSTFRLTLPAASVASP